MTKISIGFVKPTVLSPLFQISILIFCQLNIMIHCYHKNEIMPDFVLLTFFVRNFVPPTYASNDPAPSHSFAIRICHLFCFLVTQLPPQSPATRKLEEKTNKNHLKTTNKFVN